MRQIYLLPNLLTTGNLFCGVYAIALALRGRFLASAWVILAAIFFDFLDGQIARLKKATTRFGLEYDSLVDLVSFGLAPIIILYLVFFKDIGRVGMGLVFIYTACAALRLARFNTQKATLEKINFLGLPTPAAGGFIASGIILYSNNPCPIYMHLAPIVVLILSFFMVSTFKYPGARVLNLWKKSPFLNLVAVILCGSMLFLHLELFLFICFLGYLLTGIVKPRYWQRAFLEPAPSKAWDCEKPAPSKAWDCEKPAPSKAWDCPKGRQILKDGEKPEARKEPAADETRTVNNG